MEIAILETLVVANWIVLTCGALVLFYIQRRSVRLLGLPWFSAGLGMAALGCGLMAGRVFLPGWASVILASTIIVIGLAIMRRGLALVDGNPRRLWGWDIAILVVQTPLLWYRTYPHPAVAMHFAVKSLGLACEVVLAMFVVATAPPGGVVGKRLTLLGLGTYLFYTFARAGASYWAMGHDAHQFEVQFAAATLQVAFTMGLTLGGMWLAGAQLHQALESEARRDALTGLYNRRAYEEALARELERARRSGHSFAVLALDLDHLKQFNDRYGHSAGDAVLKALGQLMREQLRAGDEIARVGGDEFAALLPGQDAEQALASAERLRQAIADARPQFEHLPLAISASVGVAVYDPDLEDDPVGAALLRRADQALYTAKAAGRNRVRRFVLDQPALT